MSIRSRRAAERAVLVRDLQVQYVRRCRSRLLLGPASSDVRSRQLCISSPLTSQCRDVQRRTVRVGRGAKRVHSWPDEIVLLARVAQKGTARVVELALLQILALFRECQNVACAGKPVGVGQDGRE